MPAPSLHEVQALFWNSVAAHPGPGRDSIAPSFLGLVRGRDARDRETRIGVYSEAYFLRLRDVLREDYPRVAALLGAQKFDQVVRDYLVSFPSTEPSVRHLGRALAEFLRQQKDMPNCLSELAELEWARVEVFDALDSACATIDDLVCVPPEVWPSLRFASIPAIKTLRTHYPAHQVWSGSESHLVGPAETSLRVWRTSDWRILHAPMDKRESAALDKMLAGETFAVICETFADLSDLEAAQQATGLLARWIEDGIISRVIVAA